MMCGPTPHLAAMPIAVADYRARSRPDPDAALFAQNPLAFWNDPQRWDGIDDPRKDMIWMKPANPSIQHIPALA